MLGCCRGGSLRISSAILSGAIVPRGGSTIEINSCRIKQFLICVNRVAGSHCKMQGSQMLATQNQTSQKLETEPERRAFLRALLRASGPADSRRPLPADRIALLRQVAARWEGSLPPGAIPEIQISDACADHGVCAAVCPTRALRRYAEEGHAGLEFEATACIACGVCAVVCPENALAIHAVAANDRSGRPARSISRHAQRSCARCDDEFPARADEELCPPCRKDVGLFTRGFSARSDAT